jgi:hypothetical protein
MQDMFLFILINVLLILLVVAVRPHHPLELSSITNGELQKHYTNDGN